MKKRIAVLVLAVVAILVACQSSDRSSWIGSNVDATIDSSAPAPR